MFLVNVIKNALTVATTETITSGSENVHTVRFTFSKDWDELTKIIVFRTSINKFALSLNNSNEIKIPWECCRLVGQTIQIGAYGMNGEHQLVLPSTWGTLTTVIEGVALDGVNDPEQTPDLFDTFSARLAVVEEEVKNAGDHTKLANLDEFDQHPIGAITGLETRLEEVAKTDDYLTNEDLLKLLGIGGE